MAHSNRTDRWKSDSQRPAHNLPVLQYPHTDHSTMGQVMGPQTNSRSEQEVAAKVLQMKTDIQSKVDEAFNLLQQQWDINKRLEQEKNQLQTDLHRCQEEQKYKNSYFRPPQYNPEVDRLKKENNELHSEIVRLKRIESDFHQIRDEKERLQHENDRLNRELSLLKQRKQKTVTVQMYSAVNQKLCNLVESELFAMLSTHLETVMGIIIQKEPCVSPQDHPDNIPLIVLCVNASRLGTDVQQALNHARCDSSVAVAVLHHKEMHALPSQPSEKLLIGADYKKLGLIIDIAFVTNKGMYPCDMNERAVERLSHFISGFSQ